ncbi:hypothetical protein GQ457_09G011500 [Hibiscus cannabinus]
MKNKYNAVKAMMARDQSKCQKLKMRKRSKSKSSLEKMNVSFVIRKTIGRKIVRRRHVRFNPVVTYGLGHTDEKSLQILTKQGLLKGTKACKLKICERCVLRKYTRVKLDTAIHNTKCILDYIHSNV